MDLAGFLSLLGGLALFLYGMQMMSTGLEAAAGNQMKQILEKLTSNRFLGVAVGAGITAVIQSSSATTVMVVGFVNSGMMTLRQAVWIIMGANIGTTITGQLIAMDIGMIAPLIAFMGVAMVLFIKEKKVHHIGQIMAGLGVLFIGMDMMSASMMPLRESPEFISLMTNFSNPIIGILAGAGFTAVIQSSSASVGILQALADSGVIALGNAVYVLFGQNIGTCITAVLAAIGTSRSAKRATIIHLMFNIIGTILFTLLCINTPLTSWVESWTPDNVRAQIANMHTMFNIVTTLLLLPLGNYMADLAVRILPDREGEESDGMVLRYIKQDRWSSGGNLGFSAIHIEQLQQELDRMLDMAGDNLDRCFQAVLDCDADALDKEQETEEYIDFLNHEISSYISKTLTYKKSEQDSQTMSDYFLITGNIERIGDHAVNIGGYVELLCSKGIRFSDDALYEISCMQKICREAIGLLKKRDNGFVKELTEVAALEQRIDDMTQTYQQQHLNRMKSGECSAEACILYSEMLTDFERIGDHVLNIAQAQASIYAHP